MPDARLAGTRSLALASDLSQLAKERYNSELGLGFELKREMGFPFRWHVLSPMDKGRLPSLVGVKWSSNALDFSGPQGTLQSSASKP